MPVAEDNVQFVLDEFRKLADAALARGQEVHYQLCVGNYDVPGPDGYAGNKVGGSVILVATILSLPSYQHD
jgi:hypothetical protein